MNKNTSIYFNVQYFTLLYCTARTVLNCPFLFSLLLYCTERTCLLLTTNIILHCIALFYTALKSTVPHCTERTNLSSPLLSSTLIYSIFYYSERTCLLQSSNILHYTILHCTTLHSNKPCCTIQHVHTCLLLPVRVVSVEVQ